MSESYAREKLYLALRVLAVGEGSLEDRLEDAALALIAIIPDRDVPTTARDEFESLMHDLTHRPADIPGEGSIRSTIRHMDELERRRTAERIFDLFFQVRDVSPL